MAAAWSSVASTARIGPTVVTLIFAHPGTSSLASSPPVPRLRALPLRLVPARRPLRGWVVVAMTARAISPRISSATVVPPLRRAKRGVERASAYRETHRHTGRPVRGGRATAVVGRRDTPHACAATCHVGQSGRLTEDGRPARSYEPRAYRRVRFATA